MKYIKPIYKIKNIDIRELLFKFDFHRYGKDSYIHRFPLYEYKNKILVYGEFVIYEEDCNILHVNAVDINGNTQNYNGEEYSRSLMIEVINKNIRKEIDKFTEEGLILAD